MSTSNLSLEEIRRKVAASEQVVSEISIRAFRAIDDPESSEAFLRGHIEVIQNFGLNLSSAKEGWMSRDSVYVIIIESVDRSHVYGGSRIEISEENVKLPIETAVSDEAPEVSDFLRKHQEQRIGEICGLWNSHAVAGMGIGSVYSIRSAIAVAGLIDVKELLALCSPYTYRIAHRYGFRLLEEVGNKGAIPYAGANEIAHVTYQENIEDLPNAADEERSFILDLRKMPIQTRLENGRKGILKVHYNLSVLGD